LSIDKETITAIGLLDAEKTKFESKRSTVEFTNSEPKIIQSVFSLFLKLNITIDDWTWRLIFCEKLNLTEENVKRAEEFWISKTNVSSQMKIKNSFVNLKGKLRSKNYTGSITLNYNNLLLNNFITKLQDFTKNEILIGNKKFAYAYIDGFFSGEAYVGVRQIQVASKDEKHLFYVISLLESLGIKCGIGKKTSTAPQRLLISKVEDFIKLYQNGVFLVNPNKRRSLIIRLLNYQNKYSVKINTKLKNQLIHELNSINILLKKREIYIKS